MVSLQWNQIFQSPAWCVCPHPPPPPCPTHQPTARQHQLLLGPRTVQQPSGALTCLVNPCLTTFNLLAFVVAYTQQFRASKAKRSFGIYVQYTVHIYPIGRYR
jgi:hypothetical protein